MKTIKNFFKKRKLTFVCQPYIYIYTKIIRKFCSVPDGHLNTQVAGTPNPEKEKQGLKQEGENHI